MSSLIRLLSRNARMRPFLPLAPDPKPGSPGEIHSDRQPHGCVSSSANVFHDVKPGIVVRAIDNSITIDEHVGRLNDACAIWPMIHEAPRRGRDEGSNLTRSILIADIKNPDACVLVSCKNKLGARERAGSVFVNIVRTKMS